MPEGASAARRLVAHVIRCGCVPTAILVIALALPSSATATWSIVAVDPDSREVGVAIASCVDLPAFYYGADGVLENVVLAPGVGAGVTQGLINLDAAERIRTDLESGRAATETIEDVTAADFDGRAAERQHGGVRLDDPSSPAAFTGSETTPWAGHRTADGVSVQGNILVSAAVVSDTLAAFGRLPGKPLTDRLVTSLLAGSRAGGDSRCDRQQSALFAQVAVAGPDGRRVGRTVRVDKGDGRNPVELLAAGASSGPPESPPLGTYALALAGLVAVVLAGGIVLIRRRRRSAAELRPREPQVRKRRNVTVCP